MTRARAFSRYSGMTPSPRTGAPNMLLPDQHHSEDSSGVSRREAVAILSSLVLGVAGCGSGEGPTGPTPPPPPPVGLTPMTGTVSLPSGSGLTPGALSLHVMGQTVTPSVSGAFSASVSPIAPSMAIVTDATGTGIMAGMIDPVRNAVTISPRSSAVTLAWYAMGGPFLPATAKSQALALLAADTHMDTVAAVIAARIAVNPHAIVDGDPQIAAALTSALDALVPASLLSAAPVHYRAPAQSAAPATLQQGSPPRVTVSPQFEQSGVDVHEDGSSVGIDFSNRFRRPVKVYIYEVQKSENGTITNLAPAKLVAGPLDMGEPLNLSPVGGVLSTLLGSPIPYDPFTMGPIPLSLDGTADTTTFEVVVIGPSANGVIPSFFSAARYASQLAGWNAAIELMFQRTYYVDCIYALLMEISGFASMLPTAPSLVTAGPNTKAVVGWPWSGPSPALPPDVADMVQLLKTVHNVVHGARLDDIYRTSGPGLMDAAGAKALKLINKVDWQASLRTGNDFIEKLASPFSGYKSAGALNKLLHTLAVADRGVMWTVTLSKSNVTILPPDPTASPGKPLALSTVLSADLTGTYEYEWAQDGANGTMSASDAEGMNTLSTKDTNITLTPSNVQTAPVNVTVKVIDVSTPGHRAQAAGATVQVVMLRGATIVPGSVALLHTQQQTFTVTVDGGALPSGTKYQWTLVGQSGTIGTGTVTTTTPSISYTAVTKGTDTLNVRVLNASNVLIAKASATISVDPSAFIDITIAGAWDRAKTPPNGHYAYGGLEAGRAPYLATPLDWLSMVANVTTDDVPGVILVMFAPHSHVFAAGQTFSRVPANSEPNTMQWQLFLALDQNNVIDQRSPEGIGPLTVNTVTHRPDGKWEGAFSFTISNGTGTIVGTCNAVWG